MQFDIYMRKKGDEYNLFATSYIRLFILSGWIKAFQASFLLLIYGV